MPDEAQYRVSTPFARYVERRSGRALLRQSSRENGSLREGGELREIGLLDKYAETDR